MELNDRKIKVSVCVMTYNQEKYIRQCLQSIVDQKTNFDFEIIVGDDCSTDGTSEIVREFSEKYPQVLKPIIHKKNIGAYENFSYIHHLAEGTYIAHVDGDDFCLPGKLQAQADVLDTDINCNIVWHRMLIETADGSMREGPLLNVSNIENLKFDRSAILQYISIGMNSSKMYRKTFQKFTLPHFDLVDYFANVEQVGSGHARFVSSENFGVYRAGVGIATNAIRPRKALKDSFLYFCLKYPEYRLQINTAALVYFIADLKNRRETWPMFGSAWVKTFHIGSVFNLLINLKFLKHLRLPN